MTTLAFVAAPYAALALAIAGTIYRFRTRPFTVSSLSSQLLESRKLFWGSVPFHWGITLILLVHLVALVLPGTVAMWNQEPLRLYLLEISGFGLGLWTLAGLIVLGVRRVTDDRVRAVSTPMDYVVLGVLLVQIVSGLWIAVAYRWGSFWAVDVFAPYLRSLVSFNPRPELVANVPFALQLHAFTFFVFLGIFPFTRLVHIITVPLGYLARPWQVVVALRGRESEQRPRPPSPVSWPAAVGRSALIVVFFVIGTVWLPSAVMRMDALSDAPQLVRDLLGSGVWVMLLAAGLAGLRWAQRSTRI